ncbi:MAG: ATP-binding protein [Bryobacteraceae bacterium]
MEDLAQQAERHAAELQAIMDAVPVATFISRDPECRVVAANRAGYEALRAAPGANLSKSAPDGETPLHFRVLRDGVEIPAAEMPLREAARTGRPVYDSEFDIVFEDRTARSFLGHAVPLLDEAGQSRGAIGAFLDISDRKRMEERLRQAQKAESVGVLAAGIAHDFNNLLLGIIGNASLAQDLLSAGHPVEELLKNILQAGQQAAQLTRQMLAYSGKGRFIIEPVDLSEMAEQTSLVVHPSVSRRAACRLELAADLPPVDADRSQIQQVFTNLILNASEAIGDGGGTIAVETGVERVDEARARQLDDWGIAPGDYVRLAVRDTGCGMDNATKARIFDPFFTTKFTGRGLGLAAAAGIVRAHRGAIEVSSAPGRGSRFLVLLPAAPRRAPKAPSAVPVRRDLSGHGTILFVDDELVVRTVAKAALERYGYSVVAVEDGAAAIDRLRREPVPLSAIILDLGMPNMPGRETLVELRKISPDAPVVVSSGYTEDEMRLAFAGMSVSSFLQKPYTCEELAARVLDARA